MEIFKDIKGYNGLYQVSNIGRAKSFDRIDAMGRLRKGRILKLKNNNSGYLSINLYKNGKRKFYLVHRLVAEAFIPNPNNLPCVNHKDEDKTNNNVNNLEYCDYKYNNNYGTLKEREKETKIKKGSRNREKPVNQYDLNGVFIQQWKSASEAARQLNKWRGNIQNCCRGITQKSYGFIWKYAS